MNLHEAKRSAQLDPQDPIAKERLKATINRVNLGFCDHCKTPHSEGCACMGWKIEQWSDNYFRLDHTQSDCFGVWIDREARTIEAGSKFGRSSFIDGDCMVLSCPNNYGPGLREWLVDNLGSILADSWDDESAEFWALKIGENVPAFWDLDQWFSQTNPVQEILDSASLEEWLEANSGDQGQAFVPRDELEEWALVALESRLDDIGDELEWVEDEYFSEIQDLNNEAVQIRIILDGTQS